MCLVRGCVMSCVLCVLRVLRVSCCVWRVVRVLLNLPKTSQSSRRSHNIMVILLYLFLSILCFLLPFLYLSLSFSIFSIFSICSILFLSSFLFHSTRRNHGNSSLSFLSNLFFLSIFPSILFPLFLLSFELIILLFTFPLHDHISIFKSNSFVFIINLFSLSSPSSCSIIMIHFYLAFFHTPSSSYSYF